MEQPTLTNELVFVYGSLMAGGHNNRILNKSIFLADKLKTIMRYRMVDLGDYPGVCKYPNMDVPSRPSHITKLFSAYRPIVGEVYMVTPEVLKKLDTLENNGWYYQRELVEIENLDYIDDDQREHAWMYMLMDPIKYASQKACVIDKEGNFNWTETQIEKNKKRHRMIAE